MKNFWTKLKKPILALAPMAGYTDSALRQLCKKHGADVVYSEMVSADGLFYNGKKTLGLIKYEKKEQPFVVQLFGSKPASFGVAAQILEKNKVAGIDINFGCPAPKVFKSGGGVKLMRNLDLCYEIVKSVCLATKTPVSIKVRTSINSEHGKITALDLLKRLKGLPLAAVMVHGRSYEQGFKGEPDLEAIKSIKKAFKGIVLGNGGITTPEKAKLMLETTEVDGLGLGQGVWGKPWLFEQIKNYLKTGHYKEYDLGQIKKIALEHAKFNFQTKGRRGILEMRKYLVWYFRGFPNASELRQQLIKVETIADIKKALQ